MIFGACRGMILRHTMPALIGNGAKSMARNLVGKMFLGVLGLGLCMSGRAQARVITDWEASKLTLDALTATPVYHHPAMRHFASSHTSHSRIASNTHHTAAVRTVAYRYHAHAGVTAAHHHTRHHT